MNIQSLSAAVMLAAAIGLGAGGCKSSQNSDMAEAGALPTAKMIVPPDSVDPALERIEPQFAVTHLADRRYSLSFRGGAGGRSNSEGMNALHSITSLSFQIYAPDGRQLGSVATQDITTSGVANSETNEASLTAFGGVEWESPGAISPGTYAIAVLRSDRGALARRVEFPGNGAQSPAAAEKSVDMKLDVRSTSGGVEFTLTARRVSPGPEEEYLPSGEKYRIELRSDVGETIWSSSHGKVFTMALGPMQPGEVGSEVTYREYWNGKDQLTRMAVPPGVYRIIATLPAQPTPYILREEFTWSGR